MSPLLADFVAKVQNCPVIIFTPIGQSDRRPPICVGSITLPRSPVSLSSGDEVLQIFTRKSRLQPREFLITSAKRLFQQISAQMRHPKHAHQCLLIEEQRTRAVGQ